MNTLYINKNQRTRLSGLAASFVLLAAVSIVAAGCGGGAGSSVAVTPSELNASESVREPAVRWTAADITYSIELLSSSYDPVSDTTQFTYNVISNPNSGPAISHWMLLIPEVCEDINVIDSNDPSAGYGPDGSTGYNGLKFDTGYEDLEEREVTVVLAGEWGASEIDILVKSGNGYVIGSAEGPTCSLPPVEEDRVISGTVLLDVLVNNELDADEPGIDGIRVVLLDADGNVVAETVTDASGNYSFTVPPGEYVISIELPDGFIASGDTSLPVDVTTEDSLGNNLGASIDFIFIGTLSADGFTIGFWKNNLQKAIDGKTRGIQVDAATLAAHVAEISVFGLWPLNVATLDEAYAVLNARGSDAELLLSKQLMGSEFNFANDAFVGGDELLTRMFLLHGEYLLAHPEFFSRAELLEAQAWYDAYNNSHGSVIMP